MLLTSRAVVLPGLLGLLLPGVTRAQLCTGFPSLRETRFRAAASAASYSFADALGASFAVGGRAFVVLGAGRTRDAELDASTVDLTIAAGADVWIDAGHRVLLCPMAGAKLSLGPNDFLLSGRNFDYSEPQLGLGLTAVAARTRRLTVLPAIGVRAARLTLTKKRPDATSPEQRRRSGTDVYWLFSLALGLTLDEVWTIRPGVTVPFGLVDPSSPDREHRFVIPFGRREGELSLDIAIGFSLRRRRVAADR